MSSDNLEYLTRELLLTELEVKAYDRQVIEAWSELCRLDKTLDEARQRYNDAMASHSYAKRRLEEIRADLAKILDVTEKNDD